MGSHNHTDTHDCCSTENGTGSRKDPVCGMSVSEKDNSLHYEHQGSDYYFCSTHCLKKFKDSPETYLQVSAPLKNAAGSSRPVFFGFIGGGSLLLVFFGIVTLANGSFGSALNEFQRIWYWILILASGFGFQLGLFTYLKQKATESTGLATAEVAASGTVSTGSMVACCAHSLVNILPILGVSAAAAFLARYQTPLILVGVFSNLVGITIMLGIIQKHGVLPQNALGRFVGGHSMKTFRNVMIGLGVAIVAISFFSASAESSPKAENTKQETVITLPGKTDDRNAVTVEIKPQKFNYNEPILFKVVFETHSVDLGFDPVTIAVLEDGAGNILKPLSWDGAPPGGHHRSGTLTFPAVGAEVKSLKLILRDIAGVPERVFSWSLTEQ